MIDRKTPSTVIRIRETDYQIVSKLAQADERSIAWMINKIVREWAEMSQRQSNSNTK